MAKYTATRNPNRRPTHPGAILVEALDVTGLTRVEIAERLGGSRQQLYDILEQRKRVSPQMAVRFGRLFGQDAGLWLRMQAAHDLWDAEREVPSDAVRKLEVAG